MSNKIIDVHFSELVSSSRVSSLPLLKCINFSVELKEGIQYEKVECTLIDYNETNRMIEKYGETKFAILSFDYSVSCDRVRSLLLGSVYIDNSQFSFMAASSTGIKQRRYYLFKGTHEDVSRTLNECGDFDKIKSVSKRLSRWSLLFSGCKSTVPVKGPIKEIPDICSHDDKYNFTDGCGMIGVGLLKNVLKCAYGNSCTHIPSVIQIRYQGCKVTYQYMTTCVST